MKDILLSLARYHRWAFEVLFKALEPVHDPDYRADYGLFFKSIHGTLNHLLLVDRVWRGRVTGKLFPITGLDQELVADREELRRAMLESAEAWLPCIEGLSGERLAEPFDYHTSSGDPCRSRLDKTLLHVFNHGTHHRGQISAIITHLDLPAAELDYLYYVRKNE